MLGTSWLLARRACSAQRHGARARADRAAVGLPLEFELDGEMGWYVEVGGDANLVLRRRHDQEGLSKEQRQGQRIKISSRLRPVMDIAISIAQRARCSQPTTARRSFWVRCRSTTLRRGAWRCWSRISGFRGARGRLQHCGTSFADGCDRA